WGETGRYLQVEADGPFAAGEVRFQVEAREIAHLQEGSIVVGRWQPARRRFVVIPQSGYDPASGQAFARITRPGIYTALGLPRDPRLLATLQAFALMRPWVPVDGKNGRLFVERICQLILCADVLQGRVPDVRTLARIGLNPDDLPGPRGGGNICEQCLGI